MTKKLLGNRTVLKNQHFPEREKNSDHSSNSSGESSEGSEESEEKIQYYNGDTRFPMFGTKKRRFEAVEVLDILSTDRDKEMKCRHQPTRVQRNAAFLIDVRFVPLDDLSADGNGTYIYTGRPTQTFRKKANGDWKKKCSKRTDIDKESDFHFIREYRHLKESPDFHQTLYYARDKWGEIVNNLVLLQYQFDGPEHSIKAFPHGNSKSGKSFTRTKPSVKRVLGENLKTLSASEAVAKTRKDLGGPFKTLSDADIPRGRAQAYDMKRERSNTTCSQPRRKQIDEMTTLNWFAKTDGKGFVRMQELSSEPLMILGTDKQLADMSRFCTSHLDFTYLSVDPTFDFGEFSVTPTSYRNILLKNRNTNKSPVFVGPIFIHHTKKKETYAQFFAKLKNLAPELENLIAFGTDGETALSDALADNYPRAIHLRCFLHFRKNVESKLASLGLPGHEQYISEIFGKQDGTIYEKGLLDAASDEEFDALLASLH